MSDEKKINYTSEKIDAGDKQPMNNQGTIPNPKTGSTTADPLGNSNRDTFSETGSDPLTQKGKKIMAEMKAEYGEKKGEEVFYASANKGTISGVHGGKHKK